MYKLYYSKPAFMYKLSGHCTNFIVPEQPITGVILTLNSLLTKMYLFQSRACKI
nr:hypothetical protein [Vibrio alginolyticus]